MARFQFIAEVEYFFFAATAVLSFIQFFYPFCDQGLKLKCTRSCAIPSGVGFKNA
jgi:hypothetical protein